MAPGRKKKPTIMKRVTLLLIFSFIVQLSFCQIYQLIYKEDGTKPRQRKYVGQTEKDLLVKINSEVVAIPKLEIKKTQTLGVYFIGDAYDNFLSSNNKRLEFGKVCKSKTSGVHISGRSINDTLVILLKIKFGSGEEKGLDPERLNFKDGNEITLQLKSGEIVSLAINNPYLLYGWGATTYHFGYLIPNPKETLQLLNSPIVNIIIANVEFKMVDEFLIMRHILALMDEN